MEAAAGTVDVALGEQDGAGTGGGMESTAGKERFKALRLEPGRGTQRGEAGAKSGESGRAGSGSLGWGRGGSLSLTCMPGAAARQLRALRASRS